MKKKLHLICPLCEEESNINFGKIDFFDGKIYFCKDCKFYFMKNPPSEKQLLDFYNQGIFTESSLRRLIRNIIANIRSKIQYDFAVDYLKESNKILEVGSGVGYFKKYLDKNGLFVDIIEPAIAAGKYTKQRIFKNIDECMESKIKYDFLIFLHSLEHFPSINTLFKQIKILGSKKHKLFIELPNSPIPSEYNKELINNYLNTTHIYNFTIASMKKLLEKYGYKILKIRRYHYKVLGFFNKQEVVKATSKGFADSFILFCSLVNIAYLFLRSKLGLICADVEKRSAWFGNGDWIQVIAEIN